MHAPKKLLGGFRVGLGEFAFDGKRAQSCIRDKLGRVGNGAGLVFLLCNRIGRRDGENRIDQPLREHIRHVRGRHRDKVDLFFTDLRSLRKRTKKHVRHRTGTEEGELLPFEIVEGFDR